MPSASRAEICARTRELAQLIELSLGTQFDTPSPYDFASIARLVLMRLAGLARSVATLLEVGAEIDARMVMRSAVEHMTLLSWLAIDLRDLDDTARTARTWKARIPEENARWGGKLDGWPDVEPGVSSYTTTLRGFYRILFQMGSAAVHPHLGALVATYTTEYNDGTKLEPEALEGEVDPFVGITAYLLLYAIGVADDRLGWDKLDEALRILGRWEDVRGPGAFLQEAHALLDGRDGRRVGESDGTLLAIERAGVYTSFVSREQSGRSTIQTASSSSGLPRCPVQSLRPSHSLDDE